MQTYPGRYVDLIEAEGELLIKLTDEGREELTDLLESDRLWTVTDHLAHLLEGHTGNGWDWLDPASIGALTDAPILARGVALDDDGQATDAEAVYWHERYAVESATEMLLETGFVAFLKAEESAK